MSSRTLHDKYSRREYEELLAVMPGKDPAYLRVDPLIEVLPSYKNLLRSELNLNFSVTDTTFLDYLKLYSQVRKKDKSMVQLARHNFYYGTWKEFKKIEYPKYSPNKFMEKSWARADEYFNTPNNERESQKFVFVTTNEGNFFFGKANDSGRFSAGQNTSSWRTLLILPWDENPKTIVCSVPEGYLENRYDEAKLEKTYYTAAQGGFETLRKLSSYLFSGKDPKTGSFTQITAWPVIYNKSIAFTVNELQTPLETVKFYKKILAEAEVSLTNIKIKLLMALNKTQERVERVKVEVASDDSIPLDQVNKWEKTWQEFNEKCKINDDETNIYLNSYKEAEFDAYALKHHIQRLELKHNLCNPENPI